MFNRAKYKEPAKLAIDSIADPVGSIKYDGGHFFAKFNRVGVPSFISRRQSVKGHYPDRTANLPQFHDIKIPEFANHVVSVELIHSGNSKDNAESHSVVSGILNSLPPRAKETQKMLGPVRAVLLDVIKPSLPTYKDKINLLKKMEDKVGKPDLFYVPELHVGRKAIDQLINKTKEEGREGVIVASLTTHESQNPRLKIKHYKTYNLRIRNFLQEFDINGKAKNSLGAFELEDATGRHVGDVGTGFTRDFREHVWKHKRAWKSRLIQVRAMPPVRAGMKIKMAVYNGEADGEIDTIT